MTPTREQVALELIARNLGQQLNGIKKSLRQRDPLLQDRFRSMEWAITLATFSFFHTIRFSTPHLLRELAVTMHQELES